MGFVQTTQWAGSAEHATRREIVIRQPCHDRYTSIVQVLVIIDYGFCIRLTLSLCQLERRRYHTDDSCAVEFV